MPPACMYGVATMFEWRRIVLITAPLVGMVACADLNNKQWYHNARTVSAKAASVAQDTAGKAYKRMQGYVGEMDLLKTFHDAGEHSEAAVLDVLHKTAVGHGKNGPGPKTSVAQAATGGVHTKGSSALPEGALPGGTQPGGTQPQSSVSSVPVQYTGTLRWPLDAGIISSEYGQRWGKMHKGIDIAAHPGEPVYAIAGGDVIYAGDALRGYGNVVIVRHDQQMTSVYAHNSEVKVHQGDHVAQGTLVALLGSTGHSTGPHVHFEVREGDAAVDPRTVLPKSTFAEVLVDGPDEDEEELADATAPPAHAPPGL
ncbi:MAG: Peptidase [Gammaproteobacteria bacterium]|nr:Peptidase [Gammaproteobacteria bacterium]